MNRITIEQTMNNGIKQYYYKHNIQIAFSTQSTFPTTCYTALEPKWFSFIIPSKSRTSCSVKLISSSDSDSTSDIFIKFTTSFGITGST
eukprot:UN01530